MKTITTEEERMQLHKNGIYLEGYFNALISLKAGRSVDVIFSLLAIAIILCAMGGAALWVFLFVGIELLMLCIRPLLYAHDLRRFQEKKIKQFLKEQHIEINWATITQIDKENRQISFLEDDVKSPDGKPYIVDYIATERDCRWVVKGERIILVHIWDKKGKEILLPMIPKREFTLLREKEKCAPVRIAGIVHVPHANAFLLKENEALFHSRLSPDNSTVDLRKFGRDSSSQMPKAIFVYEWKEDAYKLKLYWQERIGDWSYGDILQKKKKRNITGHPEYYFVEK